MTNHRLTALALVLCFVSFNVAVKAAPAKRAAPRQAGVERMLAECGTNRTWDCSEFGWLFFTGVQDYRHQPLDSPAPDYNITHLAPDWARAVQFFKLDCDGQRAEGCLLAAEFYDRGAGLPVDHALAAGYRARAQQVCSNPASPRSHLLPGKIGVNPCNLPGNWQTALGLPPPRGEAEPFDVDGNFGVVRQSAPPAPSSMTGDDCFAHMTGDEFGTFGSLRHCASPRPSAPPPTPAPAVLYSTHPVPQSTANPCGAGEVWDRIRSQCWDQRDPAFMALLNR